MFIFCLFSWEHFVEIGTKRHTYEVSKLMAQVSVGFIGSRIYLRFSFKLK